MRQVEADLQANLLSEQACQARGQKHVAPTCCAQVLTTCGLQEMAVVRAENVL